MGEFIDRTVKATKESVFAAADEIFAAGQNPTITSVMARIGGGSTSTVNKYLSMWRLDRGKSSQSILQGSVLPAEIVKHFEAVITLVREDAEKAFQAAHAQLSQQMAGAQSECEFLSGEVDRLQVALATAIAERDSTAAVLAATQAGLADLRSQYALSTGRVADLEQQLVSVRSEAAAQLEAHIKESQARYETREHQLAEDRKWWAAETDRQRQEYQGLKLAHEQERIRLVEDLEFATVKNQALSGSLLEARERILRMEGLAHEVARLKAVLKNTKPRKILPKNLKER